MIEYLRTTGVVVVLLRPIYLFGLCNAYVAYHESSSEPIEFPLLPSKLTSALTFFVTLIILAAVVYIYRDELGLTDRIARP